MKRSSPAAAGSPIAGSDPLALDRQLCFALYACAHQIQRLYRPWLDSLGLTYPQYLVLLQLWQRGGRSVGELAAALRLDSGTLSPLLKRLESHGLIERQRCQDDERRVEVRLTAQGRDLRAYAEDLPAAMAAATGLPLPEINALRERLQALLAQLEQSSGPQPPALPPAPH